MMQHIFGGYLFCGRKHTYPCKYSLFVPEPFVQEQASPKSNLYFIRKSFVRLSAHNGPKLLILAPQDIPDISGYQLGFGRRFVKAYNTENPVTNQKIL